MSVSSHQIVIGILKGSKAKQSKVKHELVRILFIKKMSLNKTGSSEERMNKNTQTTLKFLGNLYNSSLPLLNWVEYSSQMNEKFSVPNGFLLYQQGLWVAEKSLSVFSVIPQCKLRTKDLEGDSDDKQLEEERRNLLWLRIDRGTQKFLSLLSCLTQFLLRIINSYL